MSDRGERAVADILVIDDDDGARATVVEMLRALGHEVVDAADGETAQQLYRERVFDLFFSTRENGSGVGLAGVRKVVEAHDGEVSVLATGPDGTEVAIDLPAA